MSVQHHQEHFMKWIIDGASFAVIGGVLLKILPALAALTSFVWGCIRIYETKTVQGWLSRRRMR